jgi:peptidyl-prolyl cis-trans isomerase B (cyclophilin B)
LKTSIDADEKKEGLKMAQIVKITMENGNQIRVELDPVQAPITVANFVKLVEDGFYNGLIFHRVIPGFMIQGGCPDGTGMGGPGWQIKGEFKRNGVNNEIQHTRGVISMARSMMPDSAGSQFFIMHQDSPHLDGQYAAFGHVIEGIETVDAIAAVKTGAGDRPVEEQKIAKIEIED